MRRCGRGWKSLHRPATSRSRGGKGSRRPSTGGGFSDGSGSARPLSPGCARPRRRQARQIRNLLRRRTSAPPWALRPDGRGPSRSGCGPRSSRATGNRPYRRPTERKPCTRSGLRATRKAFRTTHWERSIRPRTTHFSPRSPWGSAGSSPTRWPVWRSISKARTPTISPSRRRRRSRAPKALRSSASSTGWLSAATCTSPTGPRIQRSPRRPGTSRGFRTSGARRTSAVRSPPTRSFEARPTGTSSDHICRSSCGSTSRWARSGSRRGSGRFRPARTS